MNTFLPYSNFDKCAQVLDMKRLGKQRVEAYQILQCLLGEKDGWRNHPAVKMWKGYEYCLLEYEFAICNEWKRRGYKDTCADKAFNLFIEKMTPHMLLAKEPAWLGNNILHSSHRSNLLRKKLEYYSQFNWTEDSSQKYVWPTKIYELR